MTTQIQCSRCGKANEPSRLFCATCGSKMNLDGQVFRPPVRWGRGLWRLVELLLLAAMGMLLWPVQPRGAGGTEAEARQFIGKTRALAAAQERRIMIVQTVSEKEVNAYLADVLKRAPAPADSGGLVRLETRELNLCFQPESITLVVAAQWGPLKLTYELTGRPRAGGGRFEFEVRQARWGHLPLPGALSNWMVRRIQLILSGMKDDQRVLNGLDRMDMDRGFVRVATGP